MHNENKSGIKKWPLGCNFMNTVREYLCWGDRPVFVFLSLLSIPDPPMEIRDKVVTV